MKNEKVMNRFEDRMVSAAGWEGRMKPVNVAGMFFADNPDTMDGWGVGIMKGRDQYALWVDGKGFVCADKTMTYPVCAHPFTMTKETAKLLCKTGIAHWGRIFFVENRGYYEKLIVKAVKKMGYIQLDNPVDVRKLYLGKNTYTIDAIDYSEYLNLCAFYFNEKAYSLNICDTMSIVRVGRELVKTLNNKNIKL